MTDSENSKLEAIHHDVKLLTKLLMGGEHPEEGLIVRVDRLEQKDASRNKWMVAIGTASATAMVGWAWSRRLNASAAVPRASRWRTKPPSGSGRPSSPFRVVAGSAAATKNLNG